MFNKELAEKAIQALKSAVDEYNEAQPLLTKAATQLHQLRAETSLVVISEVEEFISSIADHPKQFDKTFSTFRHNFENFNGAANEVKQQLQDATIKSGAAVGAGVAGGAATAALAPTAAMAIATTFGTASTGTAIASLSGAAATNAALAWLGGGAIAAGGGGMASGGALLALAGPVGWGIAGVAVAGGAFFYSSKNKEAAEKASDKALKVKGGTNVLKLSRSFVDKLTKMTKLQADGVRELLSKANGNLPRSYLEFSAEDLALVGAVVNHVNALSELLQRNVTEYLRRHEAVKQARDALNTQGVFGWAGRSEVKKNLEDRHAAAAAAYDRYIGTPQGTPA